MLHIHLACNHYRNGMFIGRFSSIEIAGLMTLNSPFADASLKCEIMQSSFRIGKNMRYRHYGYQTWVGNWCWDALAVTPETAAAVLDFVRLKGYKPASGDAWLFDMFAAGMEIKADDLMAAVEGR